MTIGKRIFKYRKRAGLSQEELADKMNVTRQSVSLWETDQTTPSLENLITLADIFAVSMDELCDAQSSTPYTPEKSECLTAVQTEYTYNSVYHIAKISVKKFFILSIVLIALSILIGIGIIISDANNVFLIIPICFAIVFAALIIRNAMLLKKRTTEFISTHPNCKANIELYADRIDLNMTSDNSDSKSTMHYCDVKKVKDTKDYILIYFVNTIVPIEKNLPQVNYDLILKLLNEPHNNATVPQNKNVKIILLTLFIASLLSIIIAFIIAVICTKFSPLPDFPYTLPEYMWVCFLFIPLPLASAVLGIIFFIKKYKCKKNIIAGFIMCVILPIYGSFSFIFKNSASHDFGYVREIEQALSIELPDSGYISRSLNDDKNIIAMIKFDDKNAIAGVVESDNRFYRDTSFIPSSFIDVYYFNMTTGYHYFMLFDTTCNQVISDVDGQHQNHRFLYLAYNNDKNILFVYDFIKPL